MVISGIKHKTIDCNRNGLLNFRRIARGRLLPSKTTASGRWPAIAIWKTLQNTLQFVLTHVHMLKHTSIKHCRGHVTPTPFFLDLIDTIQNDALLPGEPIANIGEVVYFIWFHVCGFSVRSGLPTTSPLSPSSEVKYAPGGSYLRHWNQHDMN